MDHISRIAVFIEVVKQQSFVAAGRQLGISGPAVSKQIKRLEKQLGTKLLQRTTRQMALTEEGSLLFQKAEKALSDLDEAEQALLELKDKPTGKLKIGAPISFGNQYLVEPIAKFAKQYPQVELEVVFSDHWVDVIGEDFDLVIRIGALEDSSLIAVKLASCPIALFASRAFVDEHGKPQTIDELAQLPCIVYNLHSQANEWRFLSPQGKTIMQKPNRVFAANNAEMQLEACLQGIGIATLPAFSSECYLQNGDLIEILPEYKIHPQRGIYALYPDKRFMSARVRLLIEAIQEASKSFPWH